MSIVLAALDTTAAARAVLETAVRVAELTGATVAGIHVREGPAELPAWLAEQSHVSLRQVDGPVKPALLSAVADPAVAIAVLGARGTPGGRRPAGHTALHVLERVRKPVVVVPPEAADKVTRPFRRLLVPLEGSPQSSRSVAELLCPALSAEVEIVVLHVFTKATVPRALDHPERDLPLWGREFLARFCPEAGHIDLRTGPIGARVADVCREEDADLVVLSWSQDLSGEHAEVVREVLSCSSIPVMFLPLRTAAGARPDVAEPWVTPLSNLAGR